MSRGVLASAGLHALVFVAVLLGPIRPRLDWQPEDAIAVDLVMPTIELPPDRLPETRPEPPQPEVTPPVTDPVPEPEVVSEPEAQPEPPTPEPVRRTPPKPKRIVKRAPPKKDEGPTLAERLRQRLGEAADEEKTPEEAQPVDETAPAPAPAPSTEVEAADFPFAWYLNTVREKVLREWDTPAERMLRGNRVIVAFDLRRNGRVENVRVASPSGTPGLDASATRAVERASPFPPLPDERDRLELTMTFIVSGGE